MLHGMPEFNTIALENLDLQKGSTAPALTKLRHTPRPREDKHRLSCAGQQLTGKELSEKQGFVEVETTWRVMEKHSRYKPLAC
ncbi:hypothetical protein MC885_010382, partial [Smutsia gigantea]